MANGLISALFVIAGGACALAGYVVGSWHQRRAIEDDLASDLFASDHIDLLDDPLPRRRDQRPN
jgi:hypothetical protein